MYKIIGTHKLDGEYEVRIENTPEKTWLKLFSTQYPQDAEEYMERARRVFPMAEQIYHEETVTLKKIDGFDCD